MLGEISEIFGVFPEGFLGVIKIPPIFMTPKNPLGTPEHFRVHFWVHFGVHFGVHPLTGHFRVHLRVHFGGQSRKTMKQYPECGAPISRHAWTCPQCGRPQYMIRFKFVLLELALLAVALLWLFWQLGLIRVER